MTCCRIFIDVEEYFHMWLWMRNMDENWYLMKVWMKVLERGWVGLVF